MDLTDPGPDLLIDEFPSRLFCKHPIEDSYIFIILLFFFMFLLFIAFGLLGLEHVWDNVQFLPIVVEIKVQVNVKVDSVVV